MYVSRAVRTMAADPIPGESVSLLLTVERAAALPAVAAAVEDLGGRVEAERPFATLEVSVPQPAVADVLEVADLEAVETAKTLAVDLDGAGEDVEFR